MRSPIANDICLLINFRSLTASTHLISSSHLCIIFQAIDKPIWLHELIVAVLTDYSQPRQRLLATGLFQLQGSYSFKIIHSIAASKFLIHHFPVIAVNTELCFRWEHRQVIGKTLKSYIIRKLLFHIIVMMFLSHVPFSLWINGF